MRLIFGLCFLFPLSVFAISEEQRLILEDHCEVDSTNDSVIKSCAVAQLMEHPSLARTAYQPGRNGKPKEVGVLIPGDVPLLRTTLLYGGEGVFSASTIDGVNFTTPAGKTYPTLYFTNEQCSGPRHLVRAGITHVFSEVPNPTLDDPYKTRVRVFKYDLTAEPEYSMVAYELIADGSGGTRCRRAAESISRVFYPVTESTDFFQTGDIYMYFLVE